MVEKRKRRGVEAWEGRRREERMGRKRDGRKRKMGKKGLEGRKRCVERETNLPTPVIWQRYNTHTGLGKEEEEGRGLTRQHKKKEA